MDELTFRKKAISDPHCKDPEFLDAAEDPANRALVNELKAFDRQLESVLKVSAPEGLAERIILKQQMQQHQRGKRRTLGYLAMAASVAFAVGLSVSLLNWQQPPEMGSVALAHVYAEAPFTDSIDENVDPAMINAKLASFGGQLQDQLGKVYFVNYCTFEGAPGLHLIMQGDVGKITVFVVPDSIPIAVKQEQFGDNHLNGMVKQLHGNRLVVIGEKGEPLEKVEQKLMQAVTWKI